MDANVKFPAVVLHADDYLILQTLGDGFAIAVKTCDAMSGSHEAPLVLIKVED